LFFKENPQIHRLCELGDHHTDKIFN